MDESQNAQEKAPWITYRPELKVLDCTVRDGGLINDHQFNDEFVRAVYDTCIAAGLDTMEIGYKNSERLFPRDQFGAWRHCQEADMRRVVGDHDADSTGLTLAAMADAGKSDWQTAIEPAADSVLGMIRVAFYAHQVSEAVDMIQHAAEQGYETMANLMAVSNITEGEIETVLEAIAPTPASTMVIVDSFGHLYPEQIDRLYAKYAEAMKGHRQGDRHSRTQQHAARLREHTRGDRARLKSRGCDDGRARPRCGQLPDGTTARVPPQSKVQASSGDSTTRRAHPDHPRDGRMGATGAVQHHGSAEPPPTRRHRVSGRRGSRKFRCLLRPDRQ